MFSRIPRNPSHFGSYCQPSGSGSSRTSSASIGGKGTEGASSTGLSAGSLAARRREPGIPRTLLSTAVVGTGIVEFPRGMESGDLYTRVSVQYEEGVAIRRVNHLLTEPSDRV